MPERAKYTILHIKIQKFPGRSTPYPTTPQPSGPAGRRYLSM